MGAERAVRRAFGSVWIVGILLGSVAAAPLAAQVTSVADEQGDRSSTIGVTGAEAPAPRADGRIEYAIGSIEASMEVDGRLDEPGWSNAVVIPLAWEVNPGENSAAPVTTECRLTHDADNLYLGCTAEDAEPDRIRAYVVDRDRIGRHDRVVLTLDPFNDQRRAFQFGISALGVQFDAVLAQQGTGGSNQGDTQVDPSWDAIWASAGEITENGFVVEASIPFRSLRFPTQDAPWGVYLTRWWPRSTNIEVRSAPWDRDDSCLLCQANVVTGIRGGAPGVNVQLTPTFTSARTEDRAAPGSALEAGPVSRDFGLDAQWGITSDMTLNLTVNPDFSQVEADVAQLDVNNRFALFFPEKRPFFLEGADFFGTPIRAVFTRSIADPVGGAKVTGKLGSSALGLLVAQDQINNLLIPGSQFSSSTVLDDHVVTGIARIRQDVGSTSTVGALYTGREGSGYHNRVGGVDAFYRPMASVTLQAQALRSETLYPQTVSSSFDQPTGTFSGNAAQFRAQWNTNEWRANADFRQIDPGFRADAGFVTQAGVRGGFADLTRRWRSDSAGWFTELRLEGGTWRNEDFDGNPINGGLWVGLGYDGPWQTSIGIWPNVFMKEYFAGTTYEGLDQLWFDIRTTPTGSWSVGLNGNVGDALDYANQRQGFETRFAPVVDFRLGRNFEASVQHTYQTLDAGGGRVFTANLSQLRGVYNFSTRSLLRAMVQFRRTDRDPARYLEPVDRRSESVFAEILYSYKLNPQTVFFLGYSQNGAASVDVDRRHDAMTVMGRTLFLKLGYAWRP